MLKTEEGSFPLQPLPYSYDALEPFISARTLKIHHEGHEATYVKKLNALISGTEYPKEFHSLEGILIGSRTRMKEEVGHENGLHTQIFHNASQIWNHQFFWHCMRPTNGEANSGPKVFQGLEASFVEKGASHFGSGYVWILKDSMKELLVKTSHDGANFIGTANLALLCCDLWEHSYYLDYQNDRLSYLKNFWQHIDWAKVLERLGAS